MEAFFCKGWFRAKKKALESYTPAQAKLLHENGDLYCVLLGSRERPFCFMEITRGAVGVGFLDENLREVLSYSFQEAEPGRLFLSMATHREFDGETDKVTQGRSYIFSAGGKLTVRYETFLPTHHLETSESSIDVSRNWEPAPRFGEYLHLAKADR